MTEANCAVLIVGGGPTGLTLAIDLARRSIPFRLIESAGQPFTGSRGKGLQPRTLEVFDDLGVITAVLAAGALYPRLRIHAGPFSFRLGSLGSSKGPTEEVPYPNLWMVPQTDGRDFARPPAHTRRKGGIRDRISRVHTRSGSGASDAVQWRGGVRRLSRRL